MPVRFGDLYEEIITLEKAIERMKTDMDAADCDSITKCRIEIEVDALTEQLESLGFTDFDFAKLNFTSIMEAIERCMYCIEFSDGFSDLTPPPFAVGSTCVNMEVQLKLDDIEKITVYEVSQTPTPDQYTFVTSAMPYTKNTAVGEGMVISYDSVREGISIKGFPSASGKGFPEIAAVEITLNEPAKARYGVEKVQACKVLLTTDSTVVSTHPITNAVDGKLETFTAMTSDNKVIELVFQFFI